MLLLLLSQNADTKMLLLPTYLRQGTVSMFEPCEILNVVRRFAGPNHHERRHEVLTRTRVIAFYLSHHDTTRVYYSSGSSRYSGNKVRITQLVQSQCCESGESRFFIDVGSSRVMVGETLGRRMPGHTD